MIAIVGLGAWGTRHLVTICDLLDPGEVVGVDPREESRAAAAALGVSAVGSIDELPDGVDGAIVASPTNTHVDISMRLLRRDIHVLVEKPIALRVSDALGLIECAKDRGLVLTVGHVLLYQRAHERLRSALSGLGALRMLVLERRTPGYVMPASGAWLELAPHELAAAFDLGALTDPTTVDSYATWSVTGLGHEDGAAARLSANGCLVEVRCSWLSAARGRQVWAVAEGGQAYLDDDGALQRIAVHEGPPDWVGTRPPPPAWQDVPGVAPLELEQRAFLDAVRGDIGTLRSDGAMALMVTDLLERVATWHG